MKQLKKKWQDINNKAGVVIITHRLFGKQKISVDTICTFWDERIGVRIKKQEIYISLEDVISYTSIDNTVIVESNMKKIEINLNC